MKTVSERERQCLVVLAEVYQHEADCLFFRYIAEETGLDESKVRRSVRALARKGLAEYVRGLVDYDGMIAGSGYRATEEGALLVRGCIDCHQWVADMEDGRCERCWEEKQANETRALI